MMNVTLSDVAQRVGVRKSTVSRVLNNRQTDIPVSAETRQRILDAVRDMGYHPNAAARALKTRHAGALGYILSESVTDGWSNEWYTKSLATVEQACRTYGYGLLVSRYNLSNVESFIFPPKVGQRSVDGLIIAGHVRSEVIERFKAFKMPHVCLGDEQEVAGLAPAFGSDSVGGTLMAVRYLVSLGHRHIGYAMSTLTPRVLNVFNEVVSVTKNEFGADAVRLTVVSPPDAGGDFRDGIPIMKKLLAFEPPARPTAILGTPQALAALLLEFKSYGFKCPEDFSLIALCNVRSSEYLDPPLTSLDLNVDHYVSEAVRLLVSHIEQNTPLTVEMSRHTTACQLLIRESCAPLRDREGVLVTDPEVL